MFIFREKFSDWEEGQLTIADEPREDNAHYT